MTLRERLYYSVRSRVPQRRRLAVRRAIAQITRWQSRDTWPILPAAATPPAGWAGWPHEARCAFVLTHDVEGPRGLANVRRLAEFEMEHGFRSAFNFVPEGSYRVPPTLLDWLRGHGFEIGVHDLHHDGWLFESREAFRRNTTKINDYLRRWDAVGFRSAFMLRRLDWMGDLAIAYDASTFDVDPFEPQPGGEGTIFPFRLRSGAAELPYTLPQDSTLFLVLGEPSATIWRRKFDWIAARGGMALVNVHPDYLAFSSREQGPTTYPLARYRELLAHVAATAGVWRALPREVATFTPKLPPSPTQSQVHAHENKS